MDLDWYQMVGRTIWTLYHEELNRDPDPQGFANFIYQARENGWTVVEMRADMLASPEWHAIHDRPPVPEPVRQTGLRAMPPGSYDRVLPWTPPQTRDFLRADAWGVPIPGLPFVAGVPGSGGSSEHPERLLTGLDYKYDRQRWWPEMLRAHAERGYTHWLRWWPNARDDGGNSIQQFVDDCGRIKQAIKYVIVTLGSKVFDPRDQSVQQWQDRVGPLMDALFAAKVVDELIPAFEMDSFNVAGRPTIEYSKWVGQQAHAHGCSCWLHFFPEHTSWFADGDPRGRFGFWDDLGTDVDGLCYQSDPSWDVPMLQARSVDTLSQFGRQGNRHKFRLLEDQATFQFTRDRPDELDGCLRGFLACCTIDNVSHTDAKVWGFGNGGRREDGSAI